MKTDGLAISSVLSLIYDKNYRADSIFIIYIIVGKQLLLRPFCSNIFVKPSNHGERLAAKVPIEILKGTLVDKNNRNLVYSFVPSPPNPPPSFSTQRGEQLPQIRSRTETQTICLSVRP